MNESPITVALATGINGQLVARFFMPARTLELSYTALCCRIGALLAADKPCDLEERTLVRMRWNWIERGERWQ